jgi:hypothetical protein
MGSVLVVLLAPPSNRSQICWFSLAPWWKPNTVLAPVLSMPRATTKCSLRYSTPSISNAQSRRFDRFLFRRSSTRWPLAAMNRSLTATLADAKCRRTLPHQRPVSAHGQAPHQAFPNLPLHGFILPKQLAAAQFHFPVLLAHVRPLNRYLLAVDDHRARALFPIPDILYAANPMG